MILILQHSVHNSKELSSAPTRQTAFIPSEHGSSNSSIGIVSPKQSDDTFICGVVDCEDHLSRRAAEVVYGLECHSRANDGDFASVQSRKEEEDLVSTAEGSGFDKAKMDVGVDMDDSNSTKINSDDVEKTGQVSVGSTLQRQIEVYGKQSCHQASMRHVAQGTIFGSPSLGSDFAEVHDLYAEGVATKGSDLSQYVSPHSSSLRSPGTNSYSLSSAVLVSFCGSLQIIHSCELCVVVIGHCLIHILHAL